MLELVRGNPARLAVLLTATVLSLRCAWRSRPGSSCDAESASPISATGALAVETFSRVASFASAFIPANLGALEASSLAAVAAIGAVGGGAALALARRLRGLFWAGVGLAIYPRGVRPAQPAATTARGRTPPARPRRDAALPADATPGDSGAADRCGSPVCRSPSASCDRPLRAGYGRRRRLRPATADARTLAAAAGSLSRSLPASCWCPSRRSRAALRAERSDVIAYATAIGAGTVVSPALLEHGRGAARQSPGEIVDVAAGRRLAGERRAAPRDRRERAWTASRLARRIAVRRARALPLPSGEDVSKGRARLAVRDRHARRSRARPKPPSGAPATRTPTTSSRASTGACRCRSASR